MKSIIALLLGLSLLSFAQEEDNRNEQFSWDSADASTSQSYGGLVINVYQPDNEALVITLSTNVEHFDDVYCLNFAKTYEAIFTDLECNEDCSFEIIDGTEVDLADANCTVTETSSTQFSAICYDVNDATLQLDFTFKQDEDGAYGLEYTITLDGYTMTEDANAKFVMEQSVKDCSIEYPDSGDSGEMSDDGNNDDTSGETDGTTDAPDDTTDSGTDGTTDAPDNTDDRRRRFVDDEIDDEIDEEIDEETDVDSSSYEEAGVSSDDSKEFEVGFAQFRISGAANDVCEGEEVSSTEINYRMVDQDDSIQLVFDRFNCNLQVDPWFKIDEGKVDNTNLNQEDNCNKINVIIGAVFVGLISLFVF